MTEPTARPDISRGVPFGTRAVLVTDGLFEALADRVEWGEPDSDGWYTPALFAAPPAQPIPSGLAEALRAIPAPKRYENDENGNWWTTDMEYGWDMAIEAAIRALTTATTPTPDSEG